MITGWIVPGSWIDGRITSFWFVTKQPPKDGIRTSQEIYGRGWLYTILEGHRKGDKIYVKNGIYEWYEEATR